jgi:hypothetical protein
VEGDLREERAIDGGEIVEMLEADEGGVSWCRVISSQDRGSQLESNLYCRGESDEADHLGATQPVAGHPEDLLRKVVGSTGEEEH